MEAHWWNGMEMEIETSLEVEMEMEMDGCQTSAASGEECSSGVRVGRGAAARA